MSHVTQWNNYTFPIDYVGNGLYGVYAFHKTTDEYRLLNTNKNVYELFRYVIDIAGDQSICEMSECTILSHELEDIIENEQ